MGVIRGRHSAPGIYTKMTNIKNRGANNRVRTKSDLVSNRFTLLSNGKETLFIYFGYIPVETAMSLISDNSVKKLNSFEGDELIGMNTINDYRTFGSEVTLNGSIPVRYTDSEIKNEIANGKTYEEIADSVNNCVTIIVKKEVYENSNFDIIDSTFGISIKDKFKEIKTVEIYNTDYVFLCMFNDNFSYSAVSYDKAIAPLKIILN